MGTEAEELFDDVRGCLPTLPFWMPTAPATKAGGGRSRVACAVISAGAEAS